MAAVPADDPEEDEEVALLSSLTTVPDPYDARRSGENLQQDLRAGMALN